MRSWSWANQAWGLWYLKDLYKFETIIQFLTASKKASNISMCQLQLIWLQLILKQQGFGLCVSTSMQILFPIHTLYTMTNTHTHTHTHTHTQSPWLFESTHAELQILRSICKVLLGFGQGREVNIYNPQVIQGSTNCISFDPHKINLRYTGKKVIFPIFALPYFLPFSECISSTHLLVNIVLYSG